MNKNRIIFGVLVLSILFIFVLNSNTTTKVAKADYSDNVKIDNIQEAEYTHFMTIYEHEFYYAYNDSFHFLFIITPFNFSDIEMVKLLDQDGSFCYEFSLSFPVDTPHLKTKIENNTLEIMIRREYILIGNSFIIEIRSIQFTLGVNPAPTVPAPTVVYKTDKSDDDDEIDPVENYVSPYGIWMVTWMWMTTNPILYLLYPFISSYLISMFFRTCFRPYVFYKNKKGKSKYAGRFAYQLPCAELPGFWEIYFKRLRKMNKIYSKISYPDQIRYCYMNVGIVKYYPDIIFKKIELTDDMGIIYEQKLKDTYANKFKYFIYRLFSALVPGVLIPQWLKNTVEYKVKTEKKDGEFKKIDKKTGKKIYHQVDKLDKDGNLIPIKVKAIPLLQHQLSFDKINIICDVEYDILETGEAGEKYAHKTEEGKSIYYVEDLKRNKKVKQETIKADNYSVDLIKSLDIEEALMQQDHIDNVRSISDLKNSKISREYIELDKKFNFTRAQLDDLKRHLKSEITNKIKKIQQKSVVDADSIVEIVSIALTGYKESADVKESAKKAFMEYYSKKGAKQLGDYKSKYEIELAKSKVFEKQVKQLQNKNIFLLTDKEELDADLDID
jgi:hypothetical protein